MKKLSHKSIIHGILALCLVSLSVSCSSDEDKEAVVINSVTVNKSNAYTDEKITLNIDGTGYTNANAYILSFNTPIKIAKTAPTTFELSSAVTAPRVLVFAELSNGTDKTENSQEVSFFIHGVDNFTYAEGLKPSDTSSKVLELLGEPGNKTATTFTLSTTTTTSTNTSTTTETVEGEIWAYTAKGISVLIQKNNGLVRRVDLLSSMFSTTKSDGTKVYFTNYAGDLSTNVAGGVTPAWKINNTSTKMEAIIAKLGNPTTKATDTDNPLLRIYTFGNNAKFSFIGATVEDYTGKVVQSCSL